MTRGALLFAILSAIPLAACSSSGGDGDDDLASSANDLGGGDLAPPDLLQPGLQISPSPADFGGVLINSASRTLTLTVTNAGAADSGALTFNLGGSDAAQFAVGGGSCTTAQSLAPRASCTVDVTFAPTALGSKAATLMLTSSAGDATVSLVGVGLGPAALAFDMPSYDAGTVDVGDKATLTLTLTNSGGVDSGPLDAPVRGGSSAFSITGGTCMTGGSVPANGSCTIVVEFAPGTHAPYDGSISIGATPGGTVDATLAGVGRQTFTLTVSRAGNGNGTLTVDGVACSANPCTVQYPVTTTTAPSASVGASAAGDSTFDVWSGDCTGTGACKLTMSADHAVTATFTKKKVLVTVNLAHVRGAAGSVSATSTPPGPALTCAGDVCSALYDMGTAVTLTATAGASSLFQSWDAACANRFAANCATGTLAAPFTTAVTFRPQINYMFITSDKITADTIQPDLSGADLHCDALAKAAGLYNTTGTVPTRFKAWLSTSTTSAKSRLNGFRGWIRTDGREFADDLVADPSHIYYPPEITETGTRDHATYAITGTKSDGTAARLATSDDNCNDFTFPIPDPQGNHEGLLGIPSAGNAAWTEGQRNVFGCVIDVKLYCFEAAFDNPAAPPPPPADARFAYLSTGTFAPSAGGSRADADARCAADKGSLTTAGLAWMSVSGASGAASARLDASGGAWYRPDGVLLAATNDDFLANRLLAPIITDASGAAISGLLSVWTGSVTPEGVAETAGYNCSDWSTTSGNGFYGFAQDLTQNWHFSTSAACTNSYRVYCVQP